MPSELTVEQQNTHNKPLEPFSQKEHLSEPKREVKVLEIEVTSVETCLKQSPDENV